MQDIIQRGEMTITKVQTTHNPADVLTKHLPSATINSHLERLCLQTDNQPQSVNNLRGLPPTSSTRTIGMIGLQQPIDSTLMYSQQSPRQLQHQQLQGVEQ
eukprot:4432904-Amphidinium_carterae.1